MKKQLQITRKLYPEDLSYGIVSKPDYDVIPSLSNGLERVLFNQGVHFLRDIRTNVYNFDPFLQNITQPEHFDYDSLIPPFIPASEDTELQKLGLQKGVKFVSSTSSMTPILGHIYYLISKHKPLNISPFLSQAFQGEPRTFTALSRSPISVILKSSGGNLHSIVVEQKPDDDDETVLSLLGQSLEFLLTNSKEDYLRMLSKNKTVEQSDKEIKSTYIYSQAGPFLLRSQLDCKDPRLPRQTFDLKTRATLPIRMDIENYKVKYSFLELSRLSIAISSWIV